MKFIMSIFFMLILAVGFASASPSQGDETGPPAGVVIRQTGDMPDLDFSFAMDLKSYANDPAIGDLIETQESWQGYSNHGSAILNTASPDLILPASDSSDTHIYSLRVYTTSAFLNRERLVPPVRRL